MALLPGPQSNLILCFSRSQQQASKRLSKGLAPALSEKVRVVMPGGSLLRVTAAGVASILGVYSPREPRIVPRGFAKVCEAQGWDTQATWKKLSDEKRPWFESDNGAYIYWNAADGQWWMDEPSGNGVYVAYTSDTLPPSAGWKALASGRSPLPSLIMEDSVEKVADMS